MLKSRQKSGSQPHQHTLLKGAQLKYELATITLVSKTSVSKTSVLKTPVLKTPVLKAPV